MRVRQTELTKSCPSLLHCGHAGSHYRRVFGPKHGSVLRLSSGPAGQLVCKHTALNSGAKKEEAQEIVERLEERFNVSTDIKSPSN